MKRVKRLIAGLLNLVVLSVLFAGFCMGTGIMYYESPRWVLEKVEQGYTGAFFVAYKSKGDEEPRQVRVMKYEFNAEKGKYSDVQFHLPNGRLHGFGPWKGDASITATAEEQGGQFVKVFVIGDTPWTALSEYRVVDNKIYPLRHAHSVAWLLLGVVACPFLVIALVRKPISRGINRIMRIESQ